MGSPKVFVHCVLSSVRGAAETLEGMLDALVKAGFDGVEGRPPARGAAAKDFTRMVKDRGLRFGSSIYLPVEEEAEPMFAASADAGALYVEGQADGYWKDDAWILARTRELMDLGKRYRLPFFLETHRGRYTQDMRRTLWLLEELPELRLCGDFSHYASSCELRAPWPPEWKEPLHRIARRCGMIHGRMNAGQRVQDPLASIPPEQIGEFLDSWAQAHRGAGEMGLAEFTLTTELLGPGYQIVDLQGNRLGDLWEESCSMREMILAKLKTPRGE